MDNLGEKVAELSKRRGFFFQTSEAYGGVGGFQTFGPEGAELKRKIENSWRQTFSRELGHREIEAPTVMQEEVFRASGHLDGFDDMIIECPECGVSTRADHLVEDHTEVDEAEGLSTEQIEVLIKEHDLECPSCGEDLSGIEVDDFNLMCETSIGPGSSQTGYLRPETAQGIFVEFPRLKEYERNQLPFGITQIGKAYRNEISPRKGLVRVREFTQAELEHFIDPEEDKPNLERVKDIELKLYPISEQDKEDGDYIHATVEEAVEQGVVESPWIAYYLGIAKQWYKDLGIDMDRFRFRQHLPDERSHYASDCWDAETDIGGNEEDWLEVTGFAYRGCYDLSKHSKYSGDEKDFKIFKEYDEPRTVEEKTVSPNMGYLGPEFGDKAGDIAEALEQLAEENPEAFEKEEITLEVDSEEYTLPSDKCNFSVEEVKKSGEHITPEVVEPSFGIDRLLYTVLVHSYDEDEVDGEERRVLKLSEEMAPTEVAVFPMMDKDGMGEKAEEVAQNLRKAGFSVKYDDTGNIGKRYRRQDEVGTPYCVTVDYETLEEEPETVTIRDRDSTEQERVKISELEEELSSRL
jgi:glycyl-tRNA synthetase